MPSAWRVAKSLLTLRDQINTKYPSRSKLSDGTVGDLAHQATASDHNPNAAGVVTAMDITHDPAHGVDTWALAEVLRQRRDPRIKYVISNGRIFSSVTSPWQWRKYTGANAHAHHVHVSVLGEATVYDRTDPWALDLTGAIPSAPVPPKPKGVTEEMRQRMMKVIMGYEGNIPPQRFIAPDGRPEIAGITEKDHPEAYARLDALLSQGKTAELLAAVIAYYDAYTDPAQNWTDRAGVEFFLRDCVLNRGPTGAAEILQDAVGVQVDYQIGPTTRAALAGFSADAAVDRLRAARERYEDRKYPQRRSSGQWQGMLNRWSKAQAQAKAFQKEQGTAGLEAAVTTGIIVVGTGGAAVAKQEPWSWADIGMAVFCIGVAAVVGWIIIRKRNK